MVYERVTLFFVLMINEIFEAADLNVLFQGEKYVHYGGVNIDVNDNIIMI